jgi:hypothetical protein
MDDCHPHANACSETNPASMSLQSAWLDGGADLYHRRFGTRTSAPPELLPDFHLAQHDCANPIRA